MSEFLEEKKNEVLTLVQNKSPKKIMNIYKEVLDKIENLSKFYGFFAGTFLIDPDFYMDKVFKVYVKNITKMLNLENG